ncbi:TPA: hypothetical protein ACGJS1_006805 [Pseudomonas aeruginosa]
MAIDNSTLSPSLLGRQVTVVLTCAGFRFERTGTVIGVLQVLPGTRATPSILVDEGADRCDFHDADDIQALYVH